MQAESGDLAPATLRLAQAATLRRFGLVTAALTTLMPAIFDPASQAETSGATPYTLVWPTFRATHAQLDEASQVLVNELASDTDTNSG